MQQAIALYTFIGVWMGRTIKSNRVTGAIIGAIWFFIGLSTLLGNVLNGGARGGFERPTPVILFYSTIFLFLLMDLLCSTGAGLGLHSSSGASSASTCGSGSLFLSPSLPMSPSFFGAAATSLLMMFHGGSSLYIVLALPKSSKVSGGVR